MPHILISEGERKRALATSVSIMAAHAKSASGRTRAQRLAQTANDGGSIVNLLALVSLIAISVRYLDQKQPDLGTWTLLMLSQVSTWLRMPHLLLNLGGPSSESLAMYRFFLGLCALEGVALTLQTRVQGWPRATVALGLASLVATAAAALALRRKMQHAVAKPAR